MKYTILVYETPASIVARTDPKQRDAYWGAYRAYTQALQDAGVMTGGAGLQASATATTVRVTDGKRRVQDGPYSETKEQ
ncbi:MAG: YciI family protein, partial [Candidatus Rokubacteria bacterium]|nr:YciI family protein [Candidatus Rokubacteria bacterium]